MKIEYFVNPTELSHEDFLKQLHQFDWDVKINNKQLIIYCMDKCYHTQGGSGDNNLWCIEEGEEIKAENFRPFQNSRDWLWGIEINPKQHYSKHGARTFYECFITRNGEKFFEINGNSFDYCLTKAQYYIYKLSEQLPINFFSRNWKNELIGYEIEWYNYPAIITNYYLGNIGIEPHPEKFIESLSLEHKKNLIKTEELRFPCPKWKIGEFGEKYEESKEIHTNIFDNNIEWYPK